MTTQERAEKVPPLEKFGVLAGDIDLLRERVEAVTTSTSVDDLIELVDLDQLREQFGVPVKSIRSKLNTAGGQVFKLGKKYVIRKVSYLEALQELERGSD